MISASRRAFVIAKNTISIITRNFPKCTWKLVFSPNNNPNATFISTNLHIIIPRVCSRSRLTINNLMGGSKSSTLPHYCSDT